MLHLAKSAGPGAGCAAQPETPARRAGRQPCGPVSWVSSPGVQLVVREAAILHGGDRGDPAPLPFRDGVDGAVVAGARNLEARGNLVLDPLQLGVGEVQVLERDHRAHVYVHRVHVGGPSILVGGVWRPSGR